MRSFVFAAAAAALTLVTAGCESSTTTDTTSTVQGRLALSSFGFVPTGVDAIDEAGARSHATVAADGSFKLDLARGHVYTVVVLSPNREEPMVFPRKGGLLDRTFRVSTGAAIVALGSVRHLDRAPDGGFVTTSSPAAGAVKPQTETADGEDGECVDGHIQGSGAACVDDDAKVTCEDGSDASDGDGECQNGKDAKTGQPCTDDDNVGETGADATQPMAVPDNNPPDDVSGCKEETDDEEEDGEEAD